LLQKKLREAFSLFLACQLQEQLAERMHSGGSLARLLARKIGCGRSNRADFDVAKLNFLSGSETKASPSAKVMSSPLSVSIIVSILQPSIAVYLLSA
jgi:hypothetical protein